MRADLSTYRAMRAAGHTASHAYGIARDVADAAAVLRWTYEDAGGEDGNLADAHRPFRPDYADDIYVVDMAELAIRTAGWPYPPTLPPGARALIYVYTDQDRSPYEDDCYDETDLTAWRADDWHYVMTWAVVVGRDGTVGTAACGGTERGSYWPGTDESQIWHLVPDLLSEAADDILSTTPDLSATLADPLPLEV